MNSELITEKTYPVQFAWVFKTLSGFGIAVIGTLILFLFGFYNLYLLLLILYSPIYFIVVVLRWKNFHYVLDAKFLRIHQGVLSKQERNIPYGVIQNVLVNQDLFDRLFSLSSLFIENASQGAGAVQPEKKFLGMTMGNQKRPPAEMVGASGNKVSIPGLTKDHAEALKALVLQKMKENPIEDSQSGL